MKIDILFQKKQHQKSFSVKKNKKLRLNSMNSDQRKGEEKSHDDLQVTSLYPPVDSYSEFHNLIQNYQRLESCTWFYSDCDSNRAKKILSRSQTGSFILRNSSDPNFLYSLSIRTDRGPTSVRIKYLRELFQMDCDDKLLKILPRFENVIALVNFHVTLCQSDNTNSCRLFCSKDKYIPIKLTKPVLNSTGSLKHLSRLAVNRSFKDIHIPESSTDCLPIPQCLKDYIREYTYQISFFWDQLRRNSIHTKDIPMHGSS